MRVTVQRSLGVSVRALVASQVPDDQALVARTRQEHVRIFKRRSEGCNPSAVSHKGALEDELFGHLERFRGKCSMNCEYLQLVSNFRGKFFVGSVSEVTGR